ncbi:hypothetical protein WH52_09795 [Tenacibaculum holothuriorum]|uniref:Uncharacterized protein n=1 Tax=Tenacibaculum holothuriorum TaxID=1635173 RepID=A0A1Y2PB68_9FLAO|nr:hypothetical protein [Tenacibaculum holothuriorum]OSY87713.1 hypothetical protein WH52_09795 [Tenacibaculum holothuriorum]
MIRKILFIIICFFSVYAFSQEAFDKNTIIGTSCFYSGRQTKIILQFERLIKNKNEKEIRKKLFSSKKEERLLSAKILGFLASKKSITLSKEEEIQQNNIKNSNDEVFICSGCSFINKVKTKDFFSPTLKNNQVLLESWLHIKLENF